MSVQSDFIMDGSDQCGDCRRFHGGRRYPLTCDAFPAGIPDAITGGPHDHRHPFKWDGGIMFEPLPGKESQPSATPCERMGWQFFGSVRFRLRGQWHEAKLLIRGVWVCSELPDIEKMLDSECSEADLGHGYHHAGILQLRRAVVLLGGQIIRDEPELD